jgi:hypothetical protein
MSAQFAGPQNGLTPGPPSQRERGRFPGVARMKQREFYSQRAPALTLSLKRNKMRWRVLKFRKSWDFFPDGENRGAARDVR